MPNTNNGFNPVAGRAGAQAWCTITIQVVETLRYVLKA